MAKQKTLSLYESNVKPRLDEIRKLKADNKTDEFISIELGISPRSFTTYKKKHKELRDAIKEGKGVVVQNVDNSLAKAAIGFIGPDDRYYAPNIQATRLYYLREGIGPDYNLKKLDADIKKDQKISNKQKEEYVRLDIERKRIENEMLQIELNRSKDQGKLTDTGINIILNGKKVEDDE